MPYPVSILPRLPHLNVVGLMTEQPCAGCDGCQLRLPWIEKRPQHPRYCEQVGGYVQPYGNLQAPIFAIGEASGEDEVQDHRPFTGRSGKLIRSLMRQVHIDPDADVFWTNTVRCRPPLNRDPKPDETERCSPLLSDLLARSECKVVLCIGRKALDRILGTATATLLSKSRSTWDGYLFEWGEEGEIPELADLGRGRRWLGAHLKSGPRKGQRKLEGTMLRAPVPHPPNCRGMVACIHPAAIQRAALVNIERLKAALLIARKVVDGAPIHRGADMNICLTQPHQWMERYDHEPIRNI